jgi:DNA polymerase III subunit alpha
MSDQKFCHLHIHTDHSLMDGAMKVESLINKAVELGMKKIAVTDHGNMINMPQTIVDAKKKGLQVIPGCELYVCWDFSRHKKDSDHKTIYHMVALATNQTGWKNLLKLCSEGFLSGKYYKPRVDRELLDEYKEGIIFTTACLNGIFNAKMNKQGKEAVALKEDAQALKDILGDRVYFELQRHPNTPEQDKGNEELLKFSQEFDIPVVATCDSHYCLPEHYDAWKALMTLQMGGFEHNAPNDFYLKSQEEMVDLFKDLPEAVENTMKIADSCEEIEIDSSLKFPEYDTKGLSLEECLEKEVFEGARKRFNEDGIKGADRKIYEERLREEIGIINQMGFPGYMLVVADFVRFARSEGIYVGAGRGSAAGCLVAWALEITDVDSIKYGLLMERFLNPERVSMPDIDLDFGHRRREEVKRYAERKYGEDKVASIMTINTMAAKGALRDIGRAFKVPLPEVDKLAKSVPDGKRGKNVYLRTISDKDHEDYDKDFMEEANRTPQTREILRVAKIVEGMCRSAGTHAAGVIVSDHRPLIEHTAVMRDKDENIVTMNTMNVLEKILGLVKLDFLGLSTLTIIDDTIKAVKRNHDVDIDIRNIPMDDPKVFSLIKEGDLAGIFQLSGSKGFKEVTMDVSPSDIEEIADLTSLYRPGPLDNGFVEMYVKAKKTGKIEYMIQLEDKVMQKEIEELLLPTKGVLIYQEQVMKIVQIMAGYSLGQADILRRIMGKKIPEEMKEQRQVFIDGCKTKGVKENDAIEAFDKIAKFAEYGFNKSHAIAYSVISYQTAWLKTHYPTEYMAACLTDYIGKTDKTVEFINEVKRAGIKLFPPDINESDFHYTPTQEGIKFGLSAIKDFGDVGAEYVIKERRKGGNFKNFFNFMNRVNLSKVNKGKVETLIRAGCFDKIEAA